jgi:hypothetical protein
MAAEATKRRDYVRELVTNLPDDELDSAGVFLEWLIGGRKDPVLLSLATAPLSDEPVSQEELYALKEADEDVAAGRVFTGEEVKKRLGLS